MYKLEDINIFAMGFCAGIGLALILLHQYVLGAWDIGFMLLNLLAVVQIRLTRR